LDTEFKKIIMENKLINKFQLSIKYGFDRHAIVRCIKLLENNFKERKKETYILSKYRFQRG